MKQRESYTGIKSPETRNRVKANGQNMKHVTWHQPFFVIFCSAWNWKLETYNRVSCFVVQTSRCLVTCFMYHVLSFLLWKVTFLWKASFGLGTWPLLHVSCFQFQAEQIIKKMKERWLEPTTSIMIACTLTPTPGGHCWQQQGKYSNLFSRFCVSRF